MGENPTSQWVHEYEAVENEMREELAQRIEKAILQAFPNANRNAGPTGPGNGRIVSCIAVHVVTEFIQEGHRVRELHDNGGISWH
jgi:hypothetical protein